MQATTTSSSTRSLSRTIRKMATDFLGPRLRSALESATDELKVQATLQDRFDPEAPEPDEQAIDTALRDLTTLRDLIGKLPSRYCDALGDDIEACLIFGDDKGADAVSEKGKLRQLRRNDGLEVALLSDEELELSVLVSTVGSRFERRNREHLDNTLKSVAVISDERRAESLRGMIGVFPLINRFSSLIAAVPLSVSTRGKIMNGFQFHVLDELGRLYEPLAKTLEVSTGQTRAPAAAAADVTAGSSAAPRPASIQDWMQLLHHNGGVGARHTGAGSAGAGYAGAPSSPGTAVGVPLTTFLAQMPPETVTGALLPGAGSGGMVAGNGSLYDQVVYVVQTQHGAAPEAVAGMDLDVLRLVSLFFETFLNNDDLCPALRYLVGRLQMPVLRIALADGSFFDRDDHVARCLIETLCQIGIGWSSDMAWVERSPAYQEVSALIDRILDHPTPDAELVDAVLQELLCSQAARQEKAQRAECRVVELEVGRSRLKASKLLVQDELNRCLDRHGGLAALRTFLADSWSKVLTFVSLRHGDQSDEWHAAVDLCDELALTFTPASSRDEAHGRLAAVPALLERLETLMVEAGLTSSHIDQSIAELYREFDRIRENDDQWFASGGEMIIEREDALEPITLIPPPATPEVEHGASADTLDQILPGTWVRVREHTQASDFHQVKVAARVIETGEILLVDERGARWGIWLESAFAQAMSEGRIVLVDHDLIVQNTLDAMIAALTAATVDEEICGVTPR